jgi:quinol monooxygenase YgiN
MLIVAGEFRVDPEQREEFLRSRMQSMRVARAEPGCVEYVFSADPLDPGRIVLFERWEDDDALAAHLAAARARPQASGGVHVISSSVVKYDIAASGPLG